jgi:hypothetical protein
MSPVSIPGRVLYFLGWTTFNAGILWRNWYIYFKCVKREGLEFWVCWIQNFVGNINDQHLNLEILNGKLAARKKPWKPGHFAIYTSSRNKTKP